MENELIEEIARSICANIDLGESCGDICGTCKGQAEAVLPFMSKAQNEQMKMRIRRLEAALLEVMEVAIVFEEGDYISRAQDALFDIVSIPTVVKDD